MPTVPNAPVAPTVRAQPLPGVRDTRDLPVGLINQGARDQLALGQGLGSLGTELTRQAIDAQAQANQLRVDDALNKAKEAQLRRTFDKDTGFNNIKGVAALDRPSGKPLSDEYSDAYKSDLSGISNSLGNEQQKRLFDLHANDMLTQFRGSVMRHESEQFQTYNLSVREGTISNRMNEIVLYYNDPARVDEAVTSIKAATADIARMQGRSAEWVEAQSRKAASNAHLVALQTAVEKNDILYADAYLKRNAKDMDANDILRVNGLITKELDFKIANATVDKVMASNMPKLQAAPADRLGNLAGAPKNLDQAVAMAESGGRERDAAGNLITSPKGAQGKMQVMPGTAAAPGFGLEPLAKDATDEQRSAFGRLYLGTMLRRYNGNVPQALAAYNAGPGTVDAAIAASKDTPAAWSESMPKETKAYVARVMSQYATGDGAPPKPTLQDIHAQVRAELGPNATATRTKAALDAATHQYTEAMASVKTREDESVANAFRELEKNGGHFSDLSPATRAAIPPDKVDNVMNYGQRISKGDDITNPAVYQRLSDEKALKGLSDNEFYALRRELSEADFKHFSTQRSALHGKSVDKAGEVNMSAMNATLADRMRSLGLDPTPKDGSDEATRLGAIKQFVTDSMLTYQKTTTKQMTDAEVKKHIDGLFAQSVGFRTSFLGIDTGHASQRLLTMKASDIPGDTVDALKADFKAHGIDEPTDGDLLGAYFRLKQIPFKAPQSRQSAGGRIKTTTQQQLEADTRNFFK